MCISLARYPGAGAAGHFDDAIGVCKKLANENPTFAEAHDCLAKAYWGKRKQTGNQRCVW
jgi:hypothetical protein